MLRISSSISIPETELQFAFSPSTGPGGQNVNKVATAVRLTFDVNHSHYLPSDVKERLGKIAGAKMTSDGMLVILARRYRTQERNRTDAIERFIHLLQRATVNPRKRVPTHVSAAVREKRIKYKKQHGERKKLRKRVNSIEI